jgi:hypothetical protein
MNRGSEEEEQAGNLALAFLMPEESEALEYIVFQD